MRGVIKFEKLVRRFARKKYKVKINPETGYAQITSKDGGMLVRSQHDDILNFCDKHGFSFGVTSIRIGRGTTKGRRKR